MHRDTVLAVSVAALVAGTLACSSSSKAPLAPTPPSSSTSLPADGSTLKATAPTPQSPISDQKLTDPSVAPTLVAGASTPTFEGTVALQYRFEIRNAASALVDSALVSTPRWTVTKDLEFNSRHTWRVRAESQGDVGPWSSNATFITAEGGFIRGSTVFDPLTNGQTVGVQRGGTFIAGQGWRADSLVDGIDYAITTCTSCTVEFDVTGFGKGLGNPADEKWLSMGDGSTFGSFLAFRDHPWKMHMEQRSDGNGTGMKLIWRNGAAGDGEPGDHTAKLPSGPNWRGDEVYHFVWQWSPSGFTVTINGDQWFQDGFGGHPYAPPNHTVSLGSWPRGETLVGGIWRNVRVTPQ